MNLPLEQHTLGIMTTLVRAAAPAPRPAPGERLRDRVWRLASHVTTPLVPSDYLDMVHPLRTGGDLRARVVEVRRETREAVTVVLQPGRAWRGHVPGQYVRIGLDVDGVRRWRAYSLTSQVDRPDGCVSITVKTIPDGVVSNHVVQRVRPGQLVHLDQATGDFVLPDVRPAKVLFVTAGSGITPVMGMLRHELARPDGLDDVVLVHSAPTRDDVIFGPELRRMAGTDCLRLVEQHTDEAGMLDAAAVADLVPDLSERETWACGPTGLLTALENHWTRLGLAERLHTERFRASVVVGPADTGGTVRFSSSGTVVETDAVTPILDAGEAAGVLMPSGCRMGICYGCVLPMREGSVRDLRNGDLTVASPQESGSGGVPIQTCISAAAGPCDIDL